LTLLHIGKSAAKWRPEYAIIPEQSGAVLRISSEKALKRVHE